MRIALDLTPVKSAGTRVYLEGFVPAFARLAEGDRVCLFVTPQMTAHAAAAPNLEVKAPRLAGTVAGRLAWQQVGLPAALRRWRADVVFASFEIAPLLAPCPVVLGVRNPSPHLDNRPASVLRRALTGASCRRAEKVVYVSRASAEDLSQKLGVPEPKRVVIPHGSQGTRWTVAPEPRAVLERYGVADTPYLLFVSQLYRYKHPHTLIEAFARWRDAGGGRQHKLLMTGKAVEPGYERELQERIDALRLRGAVALLGHVPAEDVPVLYQNAAAFVMPTALETFGHPYVEAMASGVPLVCADIPVAREVCGEAALFTPVGDVEALAAAIERAVSDQALRGELVARGRERARRFTWEREAADTLALLREVAAGALVAGRPEAGPA